MSDGQVMRIDGRAESQETKTLGVILALRLVPRALIMALLALPYTLILSATMAIPSLVDWYTSPHDPGVGGLEIVFLLGPFAALVILHPITAQFQRSGKASGRAGPWLFGALLRLGWGFVAQLLWFFAALLVLAILVLTTDGVFGGDTGFARDVFRLFPEIPAWVIALYQIFNLLVPILGEALTTTIQATIWLASLALLLPLVPLYYDLLHGTPVRAIPGHMAMAVLQFGFTFTIAVFGLLFLGAMMAGVMALQFNIYDVPILRDLSGHAIGAVVLYLFTLTVAVPATALVALLGLAGQAIAASDHTADHPGD